MIALVECSAPDAQGPDIILLHGIDGDAVSSWRASGDRPVFADRLAVRFPTARVRSLGYPASLPTYRATPDLDLACVAARLADTFGTVFSSTRPAVIVGFCLGGLVAAMALRERTRAASLPPTLLFLLDAPLRPARGIDPYPQVAEALGLTPTLMGATLDWLQAALGDGKIAIVSILSEAPGWMEPYGREALSPLAPLYHVPGDHLAMVAARETEALPTLDHVIRETDAFLSAC